MNSSKIIEDTKLNIKLLFDKTSGDRKVLLNDIWLKTWRHNDINDINVKVLHLISSLSANDSDKIFKIVLKGVSIWKKVVNFGVILMKNAEESLNNKNITPETAAFWCDVLEGLTDFSFNPDIVFMILNNMNDWLISSFGTQPLNENDLNKFLKLFMMILQKHKLFVDHYLMKTDFAEIFKCCFITVLTILANDEKLSKDVLRTCGNCIGFTVTKFSSADPLVDLLQFLFSGKHFDEKEILFSIRLSSKELGMFQEKPIVALWVLYGTLFCSSCDILFDSSSVATNLKVTFEILEHICLKEGKFQYISFNVLLQWWKVLVNFSKSTDLDIHEIEPCLVDRSLHLIYHNWDSQVTKIPDYVEDMFKYVLKSDKTKQKLAIKVVKHLLEQSAFICGKYRLLNILIKDLGADMILSLQEDFLTSLIPCLEFMSLTAAVSKTFFNILKSSFPKSLEPEQAERKWSQFFLPCLLQIIKSKNELIRQALFRSWFPLLIKVVPKQFKSLVENEQLDIRSRIEAIKCLHLCQVSTAQYKQFISTSIKSLCDETRDCAFSIICSLSNELISLEDISILKEHLPLNLTSDNPSFRNNLILNIRNILIRIRSSITSHAKQKKSELRSDVINDHLILENIEFIRWMTETCLESLTPAACYQRKITVVSILKLILDAFCRPSFNFVLGKKAMFSEVDYKYLKKELLFKNLDFAADGKLLSHLFQLMTDDISNIREISAQVIYDHFVLSQPTQCFVYMNQQANHMIPALRQQTAEIGGLFGKYSVLCLLKRHQIDEAIKITEQFYLELKSCFSELKQNISSIFQRSPYGFMIVLSYIIEEVGKIKSQTNFAFLINQIIQLVDEIIQFFLTNVFSCSDPKDSSCLIGSADFEEINLKITKLLISDSEHIQLSDDHEQLLACSWLSIKNGAALLDSAGSFLLTSANPIDEDLLLRLSRTFVSILSFCRHRGAIESAFESLLNLLCKMNKCKDQKVKDIPVKLLHQMMSTLEQVDGQREMAAGSTITRRSAGLPLLVKAVLASFVKTNTNLNQLIQVVSKLQIISLTIHEEDFSLRDMQQVDAIYILKAIFSDSTLALQIHSSNLLVSTLETSFECMRSKIWVIRNAGTQLFGAISTRMLGQKHIDTNSSFLTTNEFFSQYFDVLALSRDILSSDFDKDVRIFPLLSLLSHLQCGGGNLTSFSTNPDYCFICNQIKHLIENRRCSISSAASRCFIALHCAQDSIRESLYFLEDLSASKKTGCLLPQNFIHGWMKMMILLVKINIQSSDVDYLLKKLADKIWDLIWIVDPCINPCALTAALYIQLIQSLKDFVKEMEIKRNLLLPLIKKFLSQKGILNQVGCKHLIRQSIFLMEQVEFDDHLQNNDLIILDSRLDLFSKSLNETSSLCTKSLQNIWKIIVLSQDSVRSYSIQRKGTDLMIMFLKIPNIKTMKDFFLQNNFNDLVMKFSMKSIPCKKHSSWKCSQIQLLSQIISSCFQDIVSQETWSLVLNSWIDLALTDPTFEQLSESFRLAVAHSMKAANYLLTLHQHPTISVSCCLEDLYSKIIIACLYLLNDEDVEIRKLSCSTVPTLNISNNELERGLVMNSELSTLMFLEFISKNNCINHILIFESLLKAFYLQVTPKNRDRLFEKQRSNLYIEKWKIVDYLQPVLLTAFEKLPTNLNHENIFWWSKMLKEKLQILPRLLNCSRNEMNLVEITEFSICSLQFFRLLQKMMKIVNYDEDHEEINQIIQLLKYLKQNENIAEAFVSIHRHLTSTLI